MRVFSLPESGTEGIEILPGILFDRNPRMLVTTFWGDPDAPKSDPPNFVNNADEDDSPVVLELSSCDATVLPFQIYYVITSSFSAFTEPFFHF
jgi:hypothetical protein